MAEGDLGPTLVLTAETNVALLDKLERLKADISGTSQISFLVGFSRVAEESAAKTEQAAKKFGPRVDALLISDKGTPWLPTTTRQLFAACGLAEITLLSRLESKCLPAHSNCCCCFTW